MPARKYTERQRVAFMALIDRGGSVRAAATNVGATPSTGTFGDSYDKALAEAVNGLYKTELIRRQGPWRTVVQVELANLEYVW